MMTNVPAPASLRRCRENRSFFITSGKSKALPRFAGCDAAQGIEAEFAKQIGAESPVFCEAKNAPKFKKCL
jgi:hypothetical protein